MKRVLIVSEAGDARPTGRVRGSLYRPLFEADGIQVEYVSRLVPSVVRLLDQPGRRTERLLALGAGRALNILNNRAARHREDHIVRRARAADTVYLQKVASLSLIERLRQETSARLVYDVVDGLWLPFRGGHSAGVIRTILATVDAVASDNPHGLSFAAAYNPNGYLVPDPARVELFDAQRHRAARPTDRVVLGWIGSPGSAFNLFAVWESLERLFARHSNVHLRLVGVGHNSLMLPHFEHVRYSARPFYSEDEMVREVLGMHIALFPLFDVEDSVARGIGKAQVYMSGGAAVIARPLGQVADVVVDGENGLLATTPEQWLTALTRLVEDSALRERLGAAGLATMRQRYSLAACYRRLVGALRADPPSPLEGP